jgi:pimeloyl-ACP methyl ester carboxylesterase
MGRRVLVVLLIAFAAEGCIAGESTAPTTRAPLTDCKVKDADRTARCGTLDVPEDPVHPERRHVSLRIVVLPATGEKSRPDPIVVFGGGPGEAATDGIADAAEEFSELSRERDILYVDQRGTGGSNGLQCDLYDAADPGSVLRELFPVALLTACAHRLATHADLTQYSYIRFAHDLEAVRRALGYGSMNLFAISYGTRAAQVYARQYPQSVRTMYMGSIVPIDIATPSPFAHAVQDAIDKTLSDCAADSICHTAYPLLRDEFTRDLAALDAGEARVDVRGGSSTVLPRGRFVEFLRTLLYKPEGATEVPWFIHEAALGHWTMIGQRIIDRARNASDGGFGLFFTITCNEDVGFLDENQIREQTHDTYLGDFRVRRQQAVCAQWPRYRLPRGYRDPIHTSVPTLFVSGDLDPATPLAFTVHAAPGFTQRHEIVLHGQAHGGWNECVQRVYTQLVKSGSVRGLSETCATPTPRPPFKLPEPS